MVGETHSKCWFLCFTVKYKYFKLNICKNSKELWAVVVHHSSLLLWQSFWDILHFHTGTDYILSMTASYLHCFRRDHFHPLGCTPLTRDSRWTFSYSELSCWFSICKCLGFNHAPYSRFFLLSLHSRLVIFQTYVVALLPLRIVPAIQSLCWVS